MPLAVKTHKKRSILPFLDGLITDNDTARTAIANRFDVKSSNAFAMLCHIGADVAGALQILPDGVPPTDGKEGRGGYSVLTDGDVADLLSAVREEYRDGRTSAEAVGRFSLAGAQPKVALLRTEGEQWAIPHGSTPTTHILKPVSGDFARIDIVEHMTMRAAALMGLEVAATRLRTFGAERAFITARYDRISIRGVWHRLHQEDLGQALSVPPSKKYQRQDGGPGVGAVAQLFRGLPRLEDRSVAADAFFQALMFNVTLECTDAHIKNYSVLLEGRSVKLAPLYDLATYAPYKRPGLTPYSAMKIGQEYRFDKIGIAQCLDTAKALGVDLEWARDTVQHFRRDAVGAFETARDELIGTDSDATAFATGVLQSVARLPGLRDDI